MTEPAISTHAAVERAAAGAAPSLNVPATPRQPFLAGAFAFRGSLSRSASLSVSIGTSILLLAIWEIADRLGWFDATFLPPPSDVAGTIWDMAANGGLIENALISTARVWAAFLLSAVMAVPVGMLMSTYRPVRAAFEPVVDFIRYLPVPALVPLSIIWFGVGEETKIFLLWLGTFFQLVLLVAEDMNRVPHEYVEIGYTLGARSPQVLTHIALRSMLPSLMDNLRITLGWCWTYLIIAEIVAASSGLGYVIWTARRYMQTSQVMAGVVTIGVIGLVTDQLLRALNRRLFRYL